MNDSTEARRAQPVRMPGDATGDADEIEFPIVLHRLPPCPHCHGTGYVFPASGLTFTEITS